MIRIKTHPGAIIREDYIIGLGLQQSELADALEVNKATLSRLVNERSDLTPELAIKLAQVLGGTAQSWMNLQTNFAISRAMAATLGSWRPKKTVIEGVLKTCKGQAAYWRTFSSSGPGSRSHLCKSKVETSKGRFSRLFDKSN